MRIVLAIPTRVHNASNTYAPPIGRDATNDNPALLSGTRRDESVERALFALVANRALAPYSKLAAAGWVAGDVHIAGLAELSDDACCRARDWLLTVEPSLAREVYARTADLLNLQVDLLFFDSPANPPEGAVAVLPAMALVPRGG